MNRIGKPDPGQPASKAGGVRQAPEDAAVLQSDSLQAQLKAAPDVRPEVVEKAKMLVADLQYPPEQVLRSLAHLLALKLR
ncbi:MAG TPA: hypothetical protein VEH04_02590 [Verrucomicrobiae bacterium]|nr:hypothetical protein [Verrucomicrobiae bacterium]